MLDCFARYLSTTNECECELRVLPQVCDTSRASKLPDGKTHFDHLRSGFVSGCVTVSRKVGRIWHSINVSVNMYNIWCNGELACPDIPMQPNKKRDELKGAKHGLRAESWEVYGIQDVSYMAY